MKKIFLYAVLASLILSFVGCAEKKTASNEQPELPPQEVTETPREPEEKYVEDEKQYPTDENGSVRPYYAREILVKKSSGEELAPSDEALIEYFFIEDGKGIAWVDVQFIGMQKAISQVYTTINGGKTWLTVDEYMSFTAGPYDCTHIDGKMIISNYATVIEKNIFTIINVDGTMKTIEAENVSEIVDLMGYYAEFQPSENKNEIVCHWIRQSFDNQETVYVSRHDKDMNIIDIRKYK